MGKTKIKCTTQTKTSRNLRHIPQKNQASVLPALGGIIFAHCYYRDPRGGEGAGAECVGTSRGERNGNPDEALPHTHTHNCPPRASRALVLFFIFVISFYRG